MIATVTIRFLPLGHTNVQPVGWWLNHHVNEGNEHLNFSEFLSYPIGRQYHKILQVKKELEKGDMPLWKFIYFNSYLCQIK